MFDLRRHVSFLGVELVQEAHRVFVLHTVEEDDARGLIVQKVLRAEQTFARLMVVVHDARA